MEDDPKFRSVRGQRHWLLGLALLLTLPAWWLSAAWWANGVTGYLGAPGIGVSTFAWLALHGVTGALIIAGAPAAMRSRFDRLLLVGIFLLLAGVIVLPNLGAGAGDGLTLAGLVVAALSVAQVAIAIGGLMNRPIRARLSS